MPRPSKSFLDASSRGERGISLDEADERGVVGEEWVLPEEQDESASPSSSVSTTVTAGRGWETAELKRKGCGRNLALALIPRGGETRSVSGAGVILTMGDDATRFPAKTELLAPPRLQDETESDLEIGWVLLEVGLPREVPPLMTVVELGVGGGAAAS